MENTFLCFMGHKVTYSAIVGGTVRYYIISDEPHTEWIPTSLVPGSISSCGEQGTATVDRVEGVPTVGATSGLSSGHLHSLWSPFG